MFDVAVGKTLAGGEAFLAFFAPILERLNAGQTLSEAQIQWLGGLSGSDLRGKWYENAKAVAAAHKAADPKMRLNWAGPDMSACSSITARQMETWAGGV